MDGFEVSIEKVYDLDPTRIESLTVLKMLLLLLCMVHVLLMEWW